VDQGALQSTPLGAITLAWDTAKRSAEVDSSGRVSLEPLTYSDLDDTAGGFRYLTATFRVTNLGAADLENLSLRAVARAGNAGGTAIADPRAFPDAANPSGAPLTDPTIPQRFVPLHGTQLGPSQPQPDPVGSDLQLYRQTESTALQTAARASGLLGDGDTVLDYGFVARSEASSTTAGGRLLRAGGSGTVSLAVRLPRRFDGSPRPYTFQWTLLVTTDSAPRVSRALLETDAAVLERARALSPSAQAAFTGAALEGSGVVLVPLETVRIGVGTNYP
jgi:hypothetical protein